MMSVTASTYSRRAAALRAPLIAVLALIFLLVSAVPAMAATRAWLDRSRAALGQSVVLNIESDQSIGQPDLAPLRQDFDIADTSSSQQVQIVNGQVSRSVLLSITLQPRRIGQLNVPALDISGQRTQPLSLLVTDAPAAQPGNSNAYIETIVDDPTPYVQQTVGVTLRLYYAVPLVSGQMDIDPPQGTSLQRVGDDVQSTRVVNGRQYNVVERRFLLVPDRSGTLRLPAARFTGRAAGGGFFDSMLGMGQRSDLTALGKVQTLQVQSEPANAPQPWLPLSDLQMRYASRPANLTAGQASTFTVEATARGATRAQLPDLPTPDVNGAQVFADPADYKESFDGATPVVKVTRRYSVVPNGAGKLMVPGLKMDWWDVKDDRAQTASLPDLQLNVAPGSGSFAHATLPQPAPTPVPQASLKNAAPDHSAVAPSKGAWGLGDLRLWVLIAAGFAVLWIVTLVWIVLQRRRGKLAPVAVGGSEASAPVQSRAGAGAQDLKRALATGTLDEVGEILVSMAPAPARDLDAVSAKLADPAQRQAVDVLRRARWAGGDGTQARNALREAFANGPSWIGGATPSAEKSQLPPLYPQR